MKCGAYRFANATTTKRRSGVVTAVVVVALIFLSGLVVEFARRAINDRRQIRQELLQVQTRELARAGVLRVSQNQTAKNDRWEIAPGTIHQTNSAIVEISVTDTDATVTATYPSNLDHPIQVTEKVAF